jgi:hypothetical protein
MPATADGGVVIQVVRWGWLSNTTVVASVWPPTRHDRPALEQEVVSPPLPCLPLAPRGMGGGCYGVGVHHGDEAKNQERQKEIPPTWRAKCQSGFTTLSSTLLLEQPIVVLCLERAFVSWLLVRDGHGERSGLRGLVVIAQSHDSYTVAQGPIGGPGIT